MAFSGMIPCSPTSCPSGRVPEEESVLWWALVQPAVEQSVRNAVGQALQQELRGSMQVQKEFLQYELGLHRKILESLLLLRADGSTSCTDIRPENIWTMLPVQEEHLSLAISGELHDHPQEWEAPEKATGSQDRVTSREGENQAPPQACGSEDRGNDNGQQEDVHGCADDHKHSGHVAFKDRGNSMRRSKTNADVTYEIWKEDVTHGQDVSPLHLRTLYVLDWWVNLEEPTRTGWLAAIVSSGRFESLTILVIVLNAFFMAYVANYDISHINHEPTEFITSAERFFTIFFLVELILKLCVHRRYFFVNENMKWNIFDFFLVGLAVYDQLVTLIAHSGGGPNMTFMRTLRMLKMAKMLRMARVLKAFKDLRMSFVDVADAQVVHVQDGENSDISKDVEFWHVVGMLQLLYEANQLPANECRFGEVAPRGPRIPHSRFSLGGIDKCDALAELERWRNANSLAVKLNVGEAVRESEQLKVDEGFATFLSHSNLVPVSFRQRCLQQDVRDSAPSKKGWRDRKIEVHREPKQLLPDVVKELGRQEQEKLLPRPLAVKFDGELGEGPGVNREFLRLAVQGILDGARASDEPLATLQDLEGLEQKEAALIWEYDSQLRTYWLQSSHAPPPESWSHKSLRTLGALLGHAILSGTLLPPVFPQVMYCLLLKDLGSPRSARPLTLGDLATVSPAMAKSLEKLLEYEGEDVGELFCLDWPRGNELTPMNRAEHVDAYVQWFFLERYAAQLQPLYKGFQAVVGLSPLLQNLVDSIQLEQILCGAELPIDVEAIRTGATEEGWKKDDKAYLESFWQVLLDLSDTERRSFLVFVSGCCRTPPRGWQDFALRIQRNGSGDDRLPTAYTCFNLLLLPKYTSVEVLRSRIRAAIKETEGFGLS
eukprot:gnl/TRDRNA2_/TRDRNA2_171212_c0_seq3.p1 gnl/TRDRNA2_/TRDRNA2_171212_c0~~gnl/TRDRNA2_/TRDRNA2_171212_c0_seq3.p1  ORF type:complete len:886 (+),score=161.09 gnl/TRDRNA2_/TRDRNA2_171212_c0_seq3:81-2738(+)